MRSELAKWGWKEDVVDVAGRTALMLAQMRGRKLVQIRRKRSFLNFLLSIVRGPPPARPPRSGPGLPLRTAEVSISVKAPEILRDCREPPQGRLEYGIPQSATIAADAGVSSVWLEEIAAIGPARRWFQLYPLKDRHVTQD